MSRNSAQDHLASLLSTGVRPDDSEEVRLKTRITVAAAVMMSMGGVIWGLILVASGELATAIIPFSYTILSFFNVGAFALFHHHRPFRFLQLLISLLLPFLLMIALGGYVASGAAVIWSLVAPMGAMLLTGRRQALIWFLGFLGLVVVGGLLEPIAARDNSLSPAVITLFFVLNISAPSSLAMVLLFYFLDQKESALTLLQQEQDKSERLLLNVLPKEIADMLKRDGRTIAERFEAVSILFADVVGFTPLSAELDPVEMVNLLNEVFSYFDSLAEKHGLEKIRTIGDNYMVASGVPRPRSDHAQALANMAIEMKEYMGDPTPGAGMRLQFRIGMNSGPVVAGVIGREKFHYDVWGDAVNKASRMESHGKSGMIQITQETYQLLKDEFVCEPRGAVQVKGMGELETWFLVDRQGASN